MAQDFGEAVRWYRLAAQQGHPAGQANLGFMYFQGRGVARDDVRAFALLNIAVANGLDGAADFRDAVAIQKQQVIAVELYDTLFFWVEQFVFYHAEHQSICGHRLELLLAAFKPERVRHAGVRNTASAARRIDCDNQRCHEYVGGEPAQPAKAKEAVVKNRRRFTSRLYPKPVQPPRDFHASQ